MTVAIENLDFYCVDYGQRVADALMGGERRIPGEDVAILVTRMLSVLHENGVYAALLYMVWKRHNGTKREKQTATVLEDILVGKPSDQSFLRLEAIGFALKDAADALAVGKVLSRSLEDVFLAKELLNRVLTYLRYHAKTGK